MWVYRLMITVLQFPRHERGETLAQAGGPAPTVFGLAASYDAGRPRTMAWTAAVRGFVA
jgi:hypothetical protein